MNLAIDIGNSLAKAAVIDNSQVVDVFKCETITTRYISSVILKAYPAVKNAIITSTRECDSELEDYLRKTLRRVVVFDHSTPVPIKNLYATPETLGLDRLAAAVGAKALYPGENVMVVDFGTAITIDVVTASGEFRGGNISPGASSRFRALHEFTGRLPLLSLGEDVSLVGKTTAEAISNGVVNGIVFEIEGYIARLSKEYTDLRIIFTGGDGIFFAKRFKNPIFASSDLVLYGLNEILSTQCFLL